LKENKFIMLDNDLLEKEFVYREIKNKLPHPKQEKPHPTPLL